jgi:aromatic ring-cleaving dioxygenase
VERVLRQVWVPLEYLAEALSFFTLRRRELTILIHPLTSNAVEVGRVPSVC